MVSKTPKVVPSSAQKLKKVQARLEEMEQTIRAIRAGEVDAVVVSGSQGERVFTLQSADHPYRVLVEAINEGAATLDTAGLILYANNRFAEMVQLPLNRLIGSRLGSMVAAQEAHVLAKLLTAARSVPQKKEFYLSLAGGGALPVYLSLSPMKGLDFRGICMIVTDLSAQKKRQEELAQANRILEEEIVVRKRAEHAVRQAEEVFQAFMQYTPAAVFIQDESGRYVFCNKKAADLAGSDQAGPVGKTPAEWLPGIAGKPLQDHDRKAMRSIGPTEHIEVIPSAAGNPTELLMSRFRFRDSSGRKLLGAVGVNITPQRRAEASLRHLSARLMNLRDEEQRRIARDLHDSTAQTLAALVLNLTSLYDHKELPASPNLRKLVSGSTELAEAAAKEIRNMAHLLHPPDLDLMGLSAAIRWHTARTIEFTGIKIHLDLSPKMGRLPREIETALFRVLQESLENIRRHSGSAVAHVCLHRNASNVILEISDEGRGISAELMANQASGAGVGVAGMHERLRHLGGILEIDSGKSGTKVKATIPFPVNVNLPLTQ
jgi:PAS domain S-box-containing protein